MTELIPGRSPEPTEGQIITGKRNIRLYQMTAQKYALMLDMKPGMKFSNKFSIYATIKRQYGFKGSKASVLRQLEQLIDKVRRGEVEVP